MSYEIRRTPRQISDTSSDDLMLMYDKSTLEEKQISVAQLAKTVNQRTEGKTQSYIPIDTAANGNCAFTWIRAAAPLTTPTSDATGDCLHPDVVFLPMGLPGASTANRYKKYWMVMSPFYHANTSVENPEILCSDDGTTWTVPTGLTNPIAPHREVGFNCDPCLAIHNDTLYCFWVWVDTTTPRGDWIRCKTSTDGVNWIDKGTVLDAGGAVAVTDIGPCVRNIGGTWYMWTVDHTGGEAADALYLRTSTNPFVWEKARTLCTINGTSTSKRPFHVNVSWDGNVFWAIVKNYNSATGWIMRSYDGITWDHNGRTVTTAMGAGSWDFYWYSSCMIHRPDCHYFDVFYSSIDDTLPYALHRIGRGKLYYAPGENGVLVGGYDSTATYKKLTVSQSYLKVEDTTGAVMLLESVTAGTTATDDPRIWFRSGASPANKACIGYDISASKFAISGTGGLATPGLTVDSVLTVNCPVGLVIPVGTAPTPATAGAIFLDTDASTNGSLYMYANSAWRKIVDLP